MIRFSCPLCHRTLKASDEQAGGVITCPRCQELSVVPSSGSAYAQTGNGGPEGFQRPSSHLEHSRHMDAPPWDRTGALPWGLSPWRCLVGLVAGVGVLSLLVAVLTTALHLSEGFAAPARQQAMIMVPSCVVILLVLLYGHGTSCPACGKWWARAEGETQCLGREEFAKEGETWVRSVRRTPYACKRCRHTWSATYTDEYKGSVGRRG
jgi:phage FluMu protein Com